MPVCFRTIRKTQFDDAEDIKKSTEGKNSNVEGTKKRKENAIKLQPHGKHNLL